MASLGNNTWDDEFGSLCNVFQGDDGKLTFDPFRVGIWWNESKGSWGEGFAPAKGGYEGTVTFTNGTKNRAVPFCVAGTLKKIIFSNGAVWTVQE